jgi:hypothetical protein
VKRKRKPNLTREEKLKRYYALKEKREELVAFDPFWQFEPTTGTLNDSQKAFLSKYLEEEDIPLRVDGQLDILLSDASIVGGGGGNQSGKTVTGCIRGLIKSTGELPKSLRPYEKSFEFDVVRAKTKFIRGRLVSVDFKQLHNTIIPTWRQWTPKAYLKNNKWQDSFSAQHNLLTLYRSGKPCASIEFMTNQQDVDSFQGPPLDWIGYDEEPKEDIYMDSHKRTFLGYKSLY